MLPGNVSFFRQVRLSGSSWAGRGDFVVDADTLTEVLALLLEGFGSERSRGSDCPSSSESSVFTMMRSFVERLRGEEGAVFWSTGESSWGLLGVLRTGVSVIGSGVFSTVCGG